MTDAPGLQTAPGRRDPPTRAARYDDVWAFVALHAAFRRARRAKRGKGDEPRFYFELEHRLLALSDALRTRTFVPEPYRYFRIAHPKRRLVSEASFRDRIVHHSLVAALEPAFEAQFIPFSYACRRGKGTHASLLRARRLARRHPYFLRLDIARYFDRIRHADVLALTHARCPDPGIAWLSSQLLTHAGVPHIDPTLGRGLPIGNLTSQFWANVILDPVDQRVHRGLGVGPYQRYMDDILVLGPTKRYLWSIARDIEAIVTGELGLALKHTVTQVAPVTQGIPWLGFRVFPGTVRIQAEGRKRFGRKIAASMARAASGDEAVEAGRAASICTHLDAGDCRALRRAIVAEAQRRLDDVGPDGKLPPDNGS